ncbi:MAG: HAMP domain-containing histidine kinase [Lachnospiraceae bacterium]|nr:HAMP domain-containing histidine kinase [Lachnospiraceae bacterium]
MEVTRREKTLAGLFLKFVVLFCVSTFLIVAGVFVLVLCAASAGLLLPANYAEVKLAENAVQIRESGDNLERWIPGGCTYGVYNPDGAYLTGNMPEDEQESAWEHYQKNNMYAEYKGYYRFLSLKDGNICIVKYYLIMRYSSEELNKLLPAPEALMPILDIFLCVINAVLLSIRYAKKMKMQLRQVRRITEKIAENDLEFETKTSELREINEIMTSLGRMKEALQEALKAQWDMERQRQEQLSALAHDVKTPLTVIRGNAELLNEGELAGEERECIRDILLSAEEIEKYLKTMNQVIYGIRQETEPAVLPCRVLERRFRETARQLTTAEKIPAVFDIRTAEGAVICNEPEILRAWSNIVSNAVEHTDRRMGISISIRTKVREGTSYLRASVQDYGAGFSAKDLQYADKEFYSGDTSRHDRGHSGLGLAIAKRFAEEQGGFLEYGNCDKGAEAALWLKMENVLDSPVAS